MIPEDLKEYISATDRRAIQMTDGEVRDATFVRFEELELRDYDIDSWEYCGDDNPDEQIIFKGYSLIKECSGYDSDGILIWFPESRSYGAWDCDHHKIILYPKVTWTEIIKDPTWYVNGQWYPDMIEHLEVNPWEE